MKGDKQHKGMGSRGITRPLMDMQHHRDDTGGQKSNHEEMKMSTHDRKEMLHHHHMQTLWVYWTIILLGAWMVLSPLTFSYGVSVVSPSGGREVWLPLEDRVAVMKWSDIISGLLLIFFGWRSLLPNRPVSIWIICFIGIWISFAPLIFWAPTAAIYLNGTLVGMLIIALSILIPGMPNMIMYMKMGSEVPKGWSYNPSSWPQRWIMIVLGFLGYVISRYLAAFQMGYLDTVWDPFFGDGSEKVLNSAMSHSMPISDAGMGAMAYTLEFLMGYMGSPSRWRTMPWMVALFGILVIPLGLVHVFLVISQPLAVGAWCTMCLLAAGVMLPMIALEADEVVAMIQHVKQAMKKNEKFWPVFWKGGSPEEMNKDERSPELMALPAQFGKVFKASVWGMSVPWRLAVTTILGILLMVLPGIAGVPVQEPFANINHMAGALIVVFSVIAMGEVIRAARFTNVLIAMAAAALPWFVVDGLTMLKLINIVVAVVVIMLTLPKGVIKEEYGFWNKYVV
jgi:hypothetical protein